MPQPNIRIYIILSGIIVVVLIAVLLLPLGKKNVNQNTETINTSLTPTTVPTNQNSNLPTFEIGINTGALQATLPPAEANLVKEKSDLRNKVPLTLSTFTIDFDYSQDKFTVTLSSPKDQSLKEFQDWRASNYPALPLGEFILK